MLDIRTNDLAFGGSGFIQCIVMKKKIGAELRHPGVRLRVSRLVSWRSCEDLAQQSLVVMVGGSSVIVNKARHISMQRAQCQMFTLATSHTLMTRQN